MKNTIFLSIVFALFCSCNNNDAKIAAGNAGSKNSVILDSLFERYYNENMKIFPFDATQNGVDQYNALFPIDISDAYRDTIRMFFEKYKNELAKSDTSAANDDQKMSYRILNWEVEQNLARLTFPDNYMPINQFWSLPLTLGQLGSGKGAQPFKTTKDYDNWLSRLRRFPVWTDSAIANMKKGIAVGWVLPKSLAAKVLPQFEAMLVSAPAKSVFYGPIDMLDSNTLVQTDDKKRLAEAYKIAKQTDITPSYRKLHHFFKNEYLPKCRNTSGIDALPKGAAYYQYLIKNWTTTDLKPDEIFLCGKIFGKFKNEIDCKWFETSDEISLYIKNNLPKNSAILLKGSRGLKMEKVLEGF